MTVRPMLPTDADDVLAIYAEGIATGNATFETEPPPWADWDAGHLAVGRFVAEVDGRVAGWSALVPSSQRCAYSGVTEVSVYVAGWARGQGVGKALLSATVMASEEAGYWTVLAGIMRENDASVRLHESCGFRVVGFNERVGRLNGVWRDVVRMERRSPVVGADESNHTS
jgi:L-amino acid N-acyltransferase YncA